MTTRLPQWVTTTSAGEFVALTAVLVKVIQLLAKPPEPIKTSLETLSVALLFLSVFIMLRHVAQRMSSLDKVSKQVSDIADELERRDGAGRYGLGAAAVARLLDLARREGNRPHGQAGGRILSYLMLEVFTKAAHDMSRLAAGEGDSVDLIEYHVADRFVHALIDSLPAGSAWIGISRLQNVDAWRQQTAHVDFRDFQKAVERRCTGEQINYLRLWCFDEECRRKEMDTILEEHRKAGLVQRWMVDTDSADDLSIIWVPRRPMIKRTEIGNIERPIDEWESGIDLEPLCGIRFKTRGGRELEGMTIFSPASDEFRNLCHNWERRWPRATAV